MFYMSLFNFSDEVASKLSLSEKLESILTTGVGGYLLVFAVLALIWFLLAIFGKIFDRKPKEEANEELEVKPTETIPDPVPAAPAPAEQDDAAIVAAIVAAISAYSGKPAGGFKVVSFRKKH